MGGLWPALSANPLPRKQMVTGAAGLWLVANDRELVRGRLGSPDLSRMPEELSHIAWRAGKGERVERLRLRIEAVDRVATEVCEPHLIPLVDIDGVSLRSRTGKAPLANVPRRGIVDGYLARVEADITLFDGWKLFPRYGRISKQNGTSQHCQPLVHPLQRWR